MNQRILERVRDRNTLLKLVILLVIFALLLAACGSNSKEEPTAEPTLEEQATDVPATEAPAMDEATEAPAMDEATEEPAMDEATEAPAMDEATEAPADLGDSIEIFSWWAGDEGPALQALIDLYQEKHPGVEVINAAVTGGAGTNAQAVLATRMLGGEPPDTFQIHAGQELTGTYVVADQMEDLTFLYKEEGWFDAYPQGLIDAMSHDGGIYSVPVNIHRSNVMWYVPANLKEWGVDVPDSWDAFLEICPTLQEAGVTPLAVGEAWTQNHLWESVALGVLGSDGWNGLWTGKTDPAGEEMANVWDTYGKVTACSNLADDAAGLSWQQATDKVVNGEAAFNIMGDWAAGYMSTTLKLEPGTGFGWAPSPGTAGVFMALSDSFGLPVGAPHRDNVIEWLRLMGSVEGQNAFNPLKGSIPAHKDAVAAAPDLYNAYSTSAAEDWSKDTVVPSFVHGMAANDNFKNGFASVMEAYVASGKPAAGTAALAALCTESGACGG